MGHKQQSTEDAVKACAAIAQKYGIETLETRRSDSLDFHDVAVWTIAEMLNEAYEQGRAAGATAS